MNKSKFFLTLCFFIINTCIIESKPVISVTTEKVDNDTKKITLKFQLNQNESIYTNSINISINEPNFVLSDLRLSNNLFNSFKEINKDFDLNLQLKKINEGNSEVILYVSYMQTNNEIYEENFKINFSNIINKLSDETVKGKQKEELTIDSNNVSLKNENSKKNVSLNKISVWAQELIKRTSSIWIQLLLVFVLGLLMSFTPCIYPVIPITAGILQMQGSKSILYNFFLSLSYAFGIATTFAIFGLTAALGGHFFGQILVQPAFVIFISAFLIYLAFSMLGYYDIYIPKFLTSSNNIGKKGTALSAFLFGAVSGSIASPCLSPGLALLLTIVASLANKLLGFVLLFSFGIGLSVPLILVGTFSSSINILPKAGMWMDEVKKLFGLMLIGMSFYYLSNIISYKIILWLVSVSSFLFGIFYFNSIKAYDSKNLKIFKNLLGTIFVILSIFIAVKAYQKTFFNESEIITQKTDVWTKNYDEALKKAKEENKNLIIDIGAQYCTICKQIDKKVFNNELLQDTFKKFVLVKVDATYTDIEPYVSLKKKYYKEIMGAPTILIINPINGNLLKHWRSELYEMSVDEIKKQLDSLG